MRCFVIFGSFTVKRIETNCSLDHGWSGTSVKKVAQMVNTLQGQHHAQNREISRLIAEKKQFRNAGQPGLTEVPRARWNGHFTQRFPMQTHDKMGGQSRKHCRTTHSSVCWVKNKLTIFWKRAQVHVTLLPLTENENFRKHSWGRTMRSMLRHPLSGKEFQSTSANFFGSKSDTARPSRRTRAVGGTGSAIGKQQIEPIDDSRSFDEDIKKVPLEAIVPSELEQHLAVNSAQLITNEQDRSEIQDANCGLKCDRFLQDLKNEPKLCFGLYLEHHERTFGIR